jgi:hypothetical protein
MLVLLSTLLFAQCIKKVQLNAKKKEIVNTGVLLKWRCVCLHFTVCLYILFYLNCCAVQCNDAYCIIEGARL